MKYAISITLVLLSLSFLYVSSTHAQGQEREDTYDIIEITPEEGFKLADIILDRNGEIIGSFEAEGRKTYNRINQKTYRPMTTAIDYLNGKISTKYIDDSSWSGPHEIVGSVRLIYFPDGLLQIMNVKASKDKPFHLMRKPITPGLKWLIGVLSKYLQNNVQSSADSSKQDHVSAYGMLSIGHVSSQSGTGFLYLYDANSGK